MKSRRSRPSTPLRNGLFAAALAFFLPAFVVVFWATRLSRERQRQRQP